MILILSTYAGYMGAPNIRVCSPPSLQLNVNTTYDYNNYDDLLNGCSHVFTSTSTPTEAWIRQSVKDAACKNFEYFTESGRLEANIQIQSSHYLTSMIQENNDQIRIYLYIAITMCLIILFPHVKDYYKKNRNEFRSRFTFCCYPCGRDKDEVDAAKSLLPTASF